MPAALTPEQVAVLAAEAGVRGSQLALAVAVAGAESTYRPDAVSSTGDYGLWQINAAAHNEQPTKLLVPAYNARVMARVSNFGFNWAPWEAFKSGAYRAHLAEATAAVAAAYPNMADPAAGIESPGLPGAPGDIVDDVVFGTTDALAALGRFLAEAVRPENWRRIGLLAGGAAILVLGAVVITRDVSLPLLGGALGGPVGAAAGAAAGSGP